MDSWVVWLSIIGASTLYELWALSNKRTGDTFTEKMRWLYRIPVVKFQVTAFLLWLGLHFCGVPGT